MNVAGFELTREEVVVKREFRGDTKRFEACVSDDGGLMVAIDTVCDEDVLQELRARTLSAVVQKLRKSSGLVVADKVEIFYEVEDGETATGAIAQALLKHSTATVKRIKTLPLPMALKPHSSFVLANEVVNDADLSPSAVRVLLTRAATVSVDKEAVSSLISTASSTSSSSSKGGNASAGITASVPSAEAVAMYLETMEYDRVVAAEVVRVGVDGFSLELHRGVHYFPSALDLVLSGSAVLKSKYPHTPSREALGSGV